MQIHSPRRALRDAAVWLLCSLPLLAGCASSEEEEAAAEQEEGSVALLALAKRAPEPPDALRRVKATPAMAKEGATHFAVCVGCHGAEGEGRVGQGPRLHSESFLAAASDEFLFQTIKKGRQGTTMVSWAASFNDSQIRALIAHLRSFKDVDPAELDESPLEGDAATGQRIYRSICSACHGRSGAGYQETANGTGIGRAAFLASATNGYLRYIIRHGKSQTKMRPFEEGSKVAVANLKDEEIEGVIAYLRENAW